MYYKTLNSSIRSSMRVTNIGISSLGVNCHSQWEVAGVDGRRDAVVRES